MWVPISCIELPHAIIGTQTSRHRSYIISSTRDLVLISAIYTYMVVVKVDGICPGSC
jgi:hypothetical protein